jgi:Tfp pilus assembly protein PilF
MERNTRLEATSLHLLGEGHTARAEANLRDARLLNPDTTPDFRRALLYVTKRQGDRAVATLESVVAREPDNLQAWATLLAFGRSRHDSALVQRALAAVRRLDPLEAPRR